MLGADDIESELTAGYHCFPVVDESASTEKTPTEAEAMGMLTKGGRFSPTGRRLSYCPTPAMASRKSRRSVLTARRACHRSAGAMVIDALASAYPAAGLCPN